GEGPAQRDEVGRRPRRIAAELDRLSACELGFDAAAEDDATGALLAADAQRLAGRLAGRGRLVDRALAGDDEIGLAGPAAKAEPPEHLSRAWHELAAERREGGAQAARGTGAGQLGVARELGHRGEPPLEQ